MPSRRRGEKERRKDFQVLDRLGSSWQQLEEVEKEGGGGSRR